MEWNGGVKTGVEVEICRCARTPRVPLSHHGRPIRQRGWAGWRDRRGSQGADRMLEGVVQLGSVQRAVSSEQRAASSVRESGSSVGPWTVL
jgi:hypothetical protein